MYCKKCPTITCCCCRECEPEMPYEEKVEEIKSHLGYIKVLIDEAVDEWGLDIDTVKDIAFDLVEECR